MDKKTFDREYLKSDDRSIWLDAAKWKSLYTFIDANRGKVDTIVVRAPEVLGDTYREFVLNLAALGNAGMKVEITPSDVRGEKMMKVEIGEDGSREILVERIGPTMIENKKAELKKPGPKTQLAIFQNGWRPALVLESVGPDEAYCQAELLRQYEKEQFRPANAGRAITGFYIISAQTLDEFFHKYADDFQEMDRIEFHRREILEKGWANFVINTDEATSRIDQQMKEKRP